MFHYICVYIDAYLCLDEMLATVPRSVSGMRRIRKKKKIRESSETDPVVVKGNIVFIYHPCRGSKSHLYRLMDRVMRM